MTFAEKISGSRNRWPGVAALCFSAFASCHMLMAQASPSLQTLSCNSSPRLSDTGVDALGRKLTVGTPDPHWEVANAAPTHNVYDPSHTYPWQSATVTRQLKWSNYVWATPKEGAWIALTDNYSGWPYMLYRYRFNLSEDTPPEKFAIYGQFFADDSINAVYINGVKQGPDAFVNGGWSEGEPHETTPGFFSFRGNWRKGENTLVVILYNNSPDPNPNPGYPEGLAMETAAFCGSATISKTFSRQALHPGDTADMKIEVRSKLSSMARGHPVKDVRFTDTLPAPLEVAGPVKSSTCNGSLSATPGSNKVALEGGVLNPASETDPARCEVIVPVVWPASAAAECPKTVTNTIDPEKGEFDTSIGHDSTVASADLSCESRTGEIAVHKILELPPHISGPFHFTFVADCDKPKAGSRFSGSLSFPQSHWATIDGIPARAHCSIHEELPPAPNEWNWKAPVISPNTITMPDDPKAPVSIEVSNALLRSAPIPTDQKVVPVDSKLALALLSAAVAVAGIAGLARRKSS